MMEQDPRLAAMIRFLARVAIKRTQRDSPINGVKCRSETMECNLQVKSASENDFSRHRDPPHVARRASRR